MIKLIQAIILKSNTLKKQITKNIYVNKYIFMPSYFVYKLIIKPLILIIFRKYIKIKQYKKKLLHKLYTKVQHAKIQKILRIHIYTYPVYIISFFVVFQENFVITVYVWLYFWVYFWSTMLFSKSKNYCNPNAVYINFSLCDYIALWIFLSCAPMIFYMFFYCPFYFKYLT